MNFRFQISDCRFLATAALVLASCAASVGAPETVIVPYDSTKPVAGQKPDQFYVPYDRFIELWEAAKATRRGPKPEQPATPFVLNSSRYEGTLKDDVVSFRGTIELNTFGDDWVAVPLDFQSVKLGALKLDGRPASFDDGKVLVEKPGRHVLEVEFDLPLEKGATALQWNIPRTAATLVSIALPQPQMSATLVPSSGVVEKTADGRKIVTAAMGGVTEVSLKIDSSVAISQMTEPVVASIRSELEVTPAIETVRAAFVFSFPKARQDRFTVYIDKGCAVVGLDAANLKSWKLTGAQDRQALEIVLAEPAKDNFSFDIACERPLAVLPADLAFPLFSAAAKRVEQTVAFFAAKEIEVAPKPSAAFRQVPPGAGSKSGLHPVAAFATTGTAEPLAYRVSAAKLTREAVVNYVYQVNRRKIELIASFGLQSKGRELFDATLTLPADFEVQAVQSERLKDWWRDGDLLRVRFKGATPKQTPLVVYLVKQYASAPDKLELVPLVLEGFAQVRGEAIIAAHKGVKAGLAVSGDAKEIAAEDAAEDFSILPPLERKRAFSFKQQNFHGSVTLEALPARMNALWVMFAQAHEGWLSLSTHASLSVRQGSTDRVTFSLPASLPEARVTGGEVRETTSKIDGDRRVYEVVFQNDVYESAEFTVDVDQAGAGNLALPSLAFAGVDRTDGFVLVENASEYEMQLTPSGLDTAQRSDIPFLPQLSPSASVFRAQPGWALTITMNRLEKAATRSAFVAWAEITTAIRRNGVEWNRATYHLQNRSLQFLPVKLPRGSELVSARVAGQNVRADAGEVEKQKVVLVPLIKTKPGDLSYDVEIVYRSTARGPLGWLSHRKLDDPDLVGITVEKTLWNLWLPEDFPMANKPERVGNMEMVIEEIARTEKLEGVLQELKSLGDVITSTRSMSVRRQAEYNYGKLSKSLEEAAKASPQGSWEDLDSKSNVGKKVADKQQFEAQARNRAIQSELKQEQQKLEMKPAETPASQTVVSAGTLNFSGGWASNSIYFAKDGVAAPGKPAAPVDSDKRDFYINDYVVVQKNKLAEQADREAGEKRSDASSLEGAKKIDELRKSQLDDYSNRQDADITADSSLSVDKNSLGLETARGNAAMIVNRSASSSTMAPQAERQPQAGMEQAVAVPQTAPVNAPVPGLSGVAGLGSFSGTARSEKGAAAKPTPEPSRNPSN